jgi:type IV pilus assembly protein PilM
VAVECVGLDIGSSAVKAVVLKLGRKGTRLVSFGIEPLPPQSIVDGMIMDQAAVVDAIVRLRRALGIRIKATATAISGHSVIVKKIQLSIMSADELAERIPVEVEQHFPFKRDEVDIDYQIVKPSGTASPGSGSGRSSPKGTMDVILVAAKKEIIADYMQVVRDAKLQPAVLDVAAFTIQNAFEAGYGEAATQGNIGLFHVGHALTHINIISNGVSVFARDVTVGGAAFTEELQRRLHVDFEAAEGLKLALGDPEAQGAGADRAGQGTDQGQGADAGRAAAASASGVPHAVAEILNEAAEGAAAKLQRSLDFFLASAPEFALSKIYLSGGSAHVTGLVRAMAARSKIPVEILDPFRRTVIDTRRLDGQFVKHHAAEAAVAYGLALRSPGDAAR